MGNYSTDPLWADIIPIPTDEGGPNPLASIAYPSEYGETMSYLRAIMSIPEHSPRVLDLTKDLITLNPAHYTVWLYRAATLFALQADLHDELSWLNEVALAHQKNYQIWHHRNLIVDKLGDCTGEADFVERMFEADSKNYHVWSYRQWLVKRFDLWEEETEGELEFTQRMLARDVRNNSAWNHRWFIINGREGADGVKDEGVRRREVEFAKRAVEKAPQNASPWNYLKGIVRKSGMELGELEEFAREYADLEREEGVRSSHALDLLADILAEKGEGKLQARKALDLLAEKYDPIRKNYWKYRKGLLGLPSAEVAV